MRKKRQINVINVVGRRPLTQRLSTVGGVSVRVGLTAAQTMKYGQCGRGGATVRLAPDGGVSVDSDLADPLPSGASPLPQGLSGVGESGAHRRPARVLTSTHTAPPTFVICHLMVDGFIYTEYCT